MRKLAVLLAATLTLNLVTPAVAVYAAPQEGVVDITEGEKSQDIDEAASQSVSESAESEVEKETVEEEFLAEKESESALAESLNKGAQEENTVVNQCAEYARSFSAEHGGVRINPIYADIIDVESAEQELETNSFEAVINATVKEITSKSAAVNYMRQQMVERAKTIEISIPFTLISSNSNLINEIFEEAIAHTEECTGQEGDALYWAFKSYTPSTVSSGSNLIVTWEMEYMSTAEQETLLTQKVNEIKDAFGFTSSTSEYDKIKTIHDYICDNVDYDNGKTKYTAYDALCTGTAVCEGYAVAFYRLCKEVGLSVRVVAGIGQGGAHSWNIVRIGDAYYNIDCTWDGQTSTTENTWFLLNEIDFVSHTRNEKYTSDEFYTTYPMAEYSYGKTTIPTLNLTNFSYSFTTINDTSVSSTADGKPKVLIFFKPDCYNSRYTINDLVEYKLSGVDIYALDGEKNSKSTVQEFKDSYGDDTIVFSYDTGTTNNEALWDYAEAGGIEKVTYPLICYIDANNKLQYVTSGVSNGKQISTYLQMTCGYGEQDIEYTITYHLDGGDNHVDNPKVFKASTSTITLKNPSKTGYLFYGWYTEPEFVNKITEIAKGTRKNIVLYAKFLKEIDKNLLVDKEPDSNGNYDGDYLVIVNDTEETTNSANTASVYTTSEEDTPVIMGYDEYGNALLDPNSVLPELVVDYAALAKGEFDVQSNASTTYKKGDKKAFQLMTGADVHTKVDCVCISVGESCTLWIPVNDPIYQADIANGTDVMTGYMDLLTAEFDSQYEKMTTMFGTTDYVDKNYGDNDGKTAILCYDLESDGETNDGSSGYLGGYFFGADLNCPFSNATGNNLDCIHVDSYQGMNRNNNILESPLASKGVLVHELQHMIFFSSNRTQEDDFYSINTNDLTWLNETYSAAAQHICYGPDEGSSRVSRYNSSAAIKAGWPLAVWNNNLDNYALVYLFSQYMRIQYEMLGNVGETIYKDALEGLSPSNSDLFASIAEKLETTKEELLLDYRIALQLKNEEGRYGFGGEEWAEAISSDRYYKGGSNYLNYYGAGIVTANDGSYTADIDLNQYAVAGVTTQDTVDNVTVSVSGADSVSIDETLQLRASVSPSTVSQSVQWSIVAGEDCAYININTGLLTPTKAGTVTVRATSVLAPDKYAEKTITIINNEIEPVQLAKQESVYNGGRWINYSAALPSDAEIYYTTDGSKPTISDTEFPSGGLTFTEVGEYQIKVLGHDPSGEYSNNYYEDIFEIEQVSTPAINMQECDNDDITSYNVTITIPEGANVYYTLDGSNPTVDSKKYTESFVVDSIGKTTIKAFATKAGSVSSDIVQKEVEVRYKVKSISIDKEEVILYVGDSDNNTVTLNATVLPKEAEQAVKWESEDEKIATVDENGKVTAVAKGIVNIKASADGKTAVCVVEVKKKDFVIDEDGVLLEYNGTDKEVIIPDGVKEIGEYAFYENDTITSVIIPSTVSLVVDSAFYNCDAIEEIIFKNGATSELTFKKTGGISGVFTDCAKLKKVVLPERLSVLPESTFLLCPNLNAVYIPASVTDIAEDVFVSCDKRVIYGVKGSYAETFAKANAIPFIDRVEMGLFVSEIYLNQTKITVSGAEYINNPEKTFTLKAFVKPVTAENKQVIFTSEDENVARVDKNGDVMITGYGTTNIVAVSEENEALTSTCKVVVLKEWTEEEKTYVREFINSNNDFTVITNIYENLNEVAITAPEGITAEWKYPYEIVSGTKKYDVVLKCDGYVDAVLEDIEVTGIKVTGITMHTEGKVEPGESTEAFIEIEVEGNEEYAELSSDQYVVNWKSSKSSSLLVEACETDDLQAVVTGVAKNNNTKVTAKLILLKDGEACATTKADMGKTWFSASSKVVVTAYPVVDDIEITAENTEGTIELDSFEEFLNLTERQIYTLTAESFRNGEIIEDVPLTWKSGDTKVATVKKQNDGTAVLTVLGKGTSVITVSASKNGGYSESFRVTVKDSMPRLLQKNISINAYKQDAVAEIQILPSDGYEVDNNSLDIVTSKGEESAFTIESMEDNVYEIRLQEENKADIKNGTHSVKILVTTDACEEECYKLPLKIKVERKTPAVSIKQTPINLFEEDGRGEVKVITDAEISEISYEPKKTTGVYLEEYDTDTENKILCVHAMGANSTNYKNAANKGTLRISFEGYEEAADYKKPITLSVNKKLPVFTAIPVSDTLYPQTLADTTEIQLFDKSKQNDIFGDTEYTIESSNVPSTYEYVAHTESSLPTVTALAGARKQNITYTISNNAWIEGIKTTAKCTLKIGKVPTLLLGSGKVTFNTAYAIGDYDAVPIETYVKGFKHIELDSVSIEGKDAKSKSALNDGAFAFELNNGVLEGGIADRKYFTKAGNYTYIVTAYTEEGKPVAGTLKVSVVMAKNVPAISFKTKGSINLLDRIGTSIKATPTLKNYSGKIVGVELQGTNADKFLAEADENGNVIIRARENEALKTKTNYTLSLDVELDSGVHVLSKVKISLKQITPKLVQNTKEIVLFETAKGEAYGKEFEVRLKDENSSGEIERIRLVTETDTFAYTGVVFVKDKPSLKPGKKYTLKFEVYFVDAGMNVKPTVVSLKVDYRK